MNKICEMCQKEFESQSARRFCDDCKAVRERENRVKRNAAYRERIQSDPDFREKRRAAYRKYYEKHREKILARTKASRANTVMA